MSLQCNDSGARRRAAPLLAFLVSTAAFAAEPVKPVEPCVSAVVTHEEESTTPSGLERRERYRERYLRCGDAVWMERLVPAAARKGAPPRGARELDLDVSARWVTRARDGAPRVALVDREHHRLIELSKADFEEVGFAGSWDAAARLVPAELLRGLVEKVSERPGEKVYEGTAGGAKVRVEWLARVELPRSMDVTSADGLRHSRLTVELEAPPAPGTRPWDEVRGWPRKDFADLGD